jgi:hypothetical protein
MRVINNCIITITLSQRTVKRTDGKELKLKSITLSC